MQSLKEKTPGIEVDVAEFIERLKEHEDRLKPYSQEWYDSISARIGDATCKLLGLYVIPDDFVLSVVIPVYNEERTLRNLVDRVREVPIRKEIVLVDDCSKDNSREIMKQIAGDYADDPMNSFALDYLSLIHI